MADTPRTRASASADDKKDTPTVAEAIAEVKVEEDPVFTHERLINESAAFFGEPSWIVAGAISSISKKYLSEAEVKAAIKVFLATEVS